MIRINLLPPEIIEKRKDEGRWRWVGLAAGVLAVALIGTFLILQFEVSLKQNEVAAVKQTAEGVKQQTERFQVFQAKRTDLANRRAIALSAIAGRVDWPRLLSEVALILPTDIYLIRVGTVEPKVAGGAGAGAAAGPAVPGKLTMDGRALDVPNDVPDLGYRSIAKLLVRLAGLDQLDNVWLSSSVKPPLVPEGTAPSADSVFITFTVAADINSTTSTLVPTPVSSGATQP